MTIEIRESPKLRIVEQSALVQGAALETRRILVSSGVLRRAQPAERLLGHGEPAAHLALVGQGHLRVWRPVLGAPARVAGYRSVGEVAGEAALGGAATYDESAEAMTDVEALFLPRDAVLELLTRDPSLGAAVRRLLLARHQAAEERVCSLLRDSVQARLAEFLLAAAGRWGIPAGEGVRISARLGHAEIASVIGSTRETVTGALGNLRRAGVIAHDRRQVIILQRDVLRTTASAPRPPSRGSELTAEAGAGAGRPPSRGSELTADAASG
jgi:CRP-like cAMP-binding protein